MSQPPQPDSRQIHARTQAGDDEIAARALDLTQAARRILALIDARRSVAELSQFARPGELGPVLEALERNGLIAAVGLAAEPTEAQRRAHQRAEQKHLQQLKVSLRGAFAAELGTAGRVWDARVADSVSTQVLRRTLREAVDVVEARCGETAAQRVLARVRPLFARAR